MWRLAGKHGLLGMDVETEYGGGGVDDYRYHVVVSEEFARAGVHAPALSLHNEVIGAYLRSLATPEQRGRWLPSFCSGELITAIAITEPDAGSDLTRLRTTARRTEDGFVLNGTKTFISHGGLADLVIVLARDGDGDGLDLLAVERGMPGFRVGTHIHKLGMNALDTVELSFDDVLVPAENLLGKRGRAMAYLLRHLKQERLWLATSALAGAERVVSDTIAYCRGREVSGGPLTSTEPVLSSADVADGAHINAVGSSFPTARELTGDLVGRCRIFADSLTSAREESGDLRMAADEGFVDLADVDNEVGEVIAATKPGRTSADEVTLFESLGLAAEDVVTGLELYHRALASGCGTRIDFHDA